MKNLIEAACILMAVVGIALWSIPAALVVAGVVGAVACEVRS